MGRYLIKSQSQTSQFEKLWGFLEILLTSHLGNRFLVHGLAFFQKAGVATCGWRSSSHILGFWHLLHPQSYNNLITSKGKDEVVMGSSPTSKCMTTWGFNGGRNSKLIQSKKMTWLLWGFYLNWHTDVEIVVHGFLQLKASNSNIWPRGSPFILVLMFVVSTKLQQLHHL